MPVGDSFEKGAGSGAGGAASGAVDVLGATCIPYRWLRSVGSEAKGKTDVEADGVPDGRPRARRDVPAAVLHELTDQAEDDEGDGDDGEEGERPEASGSCQSRAAGATLGLAAGTTREVVVDNSVKTSRSADSAKTSSSAASTFGCTTGGSNDGSDGADA